MLDILLFKFHSDLLDALHLDGQSVLFGHTFHFTLGHEIPQILYPFDLASGESRHSQLSTHPPSVTIVAGHDLLLMFLAPPGRYGSGQILTGTRSAALLDCNSEMIFLSLFHIHFDDLMNNVFVFRHCKITTIIHAKKGKNHLRMPHSMPL
jgi:hypothetical protein